MFRNDAGAGGLHGDEINWKVARKLESEEKDKEFMTWLITTFESEGRKSWEQQLKLPVKEEIWDNKPEKEKRLIQLQNLFSSIAHYADFNSISPDRKYGKKWVYVKYNDYYFYLWYEVSHDKKVFVYADLASSEEIEDKVIIDYEWIRNNISYEKAIQMMFKDTINEIKNNLTVLSNLNIKEGIIKPSEYYSLSKINSRLNLFIEENKKKQLKI